MVNLYIPHVRVEDREDLMIHSILASNSLPPPLTKVATLAKEASKFKSIASNPTSKAIIVSGLARLDQSIARLCTNEPEVASLTVPEGPCTLAAHLLDAESSLNDDGSVRAINLLGNSNVTEESRGLGPRLKLDTHLSNPSSCGNH
jgi:hypothetical protein